MRIHLNSPQLEGDASGKKPVRMADHPQLKLRSSNRAENRADLDSVSN